MPHSPISGEHTLSYSGTECTYSAAEHSSPPSSPSSASSASSTSAASSSLPSFRLPSPQLGIQIGGKGKSRGRCNSTESSPSMSSCRCKRASISSSPPAISLFPKGSSTHSAPPSPALPPGIAFPFQNHTTDPLQLPLPLPLDPPLPGAPPSRHLKRPVPDPRGFEPILEFHDEPLYHNPSHNEDLTPHLPWSAPNTTTASHTPSHTVPHGLKAPVPAIDHSTEVVVVLGDGTGQDADESARAGVSSNHLRPTSPLTPPKTRRRLESQTSNPDMLQTSSFSSKIFSSSSASASASSFSSSSLSSSSSSSSSAPPYHKAPTARKSLDLTKLSNYGSHQDLYKLGNFNTEPDHKFTPPPSPTPNKRWSVFSSANSIRFKSNINPFTPEGRTMKPPLDPNFIVEEGTAATMHSLQNAQKHSKSSQISDDEDQTYHKNFEQMSLLGKGTYGEVFKCRHRIDGCCYAVKKTIRKLRGIRDRQNVLREVYGLAAITDHSYILRYYGAWEEGEKVYIQTELCEGGTLEDQLTAGSKFTEDQLREITFQVASGLSHIHSLGLVHLDIKPANIYIKSPTVATGKPEPTTVATTKATTSNQPTSLSLPMGAMVPNLLRPCRGIGEVNYKIGDLGLMSDAVSSKVFMDGDCRYLSRELLGDDMSCPRKSDVFSFGASIYELSLGRRLPQGGKEWEQIRNGILCRSATNEYSELFWDLVHSCMHPEPTKRPSTEEILQHPFVQVSQRYNITTLNIAFKLAQQELHSLQQQVLFLTQQLANQPSSPPPLPSTVATLTNLPSVTIAAIPSNNEHLTNKLDKMQL